MKRIIIDHFEGETVICESENKESMFLLKRDLPANAKAGDCLVLDPSGKFMIDEECTKKRRELIQKKLDHLWE